MQTLNDEENMKQLHFHSLLHLALTALLFVTLACRGSISSIPSGVALTQTQQAVSLFTTPTQATATPSPSLTPSVPTATSTPAPTATTSTASELPAATRIQFAAGATSSLAQGTIQAGQTLHYALRALEEQPIIVALDTTDNSAKLSVFGANGTMLLSPSQQSTSWQGYLPVTQDYYFRVTGGGSTQNFTLNVNIPARIQFESGQDQVTLNGQTSGGRAVMYAAYAFGGQELEVTLDTAPEVAALTIWGFSDGQPYARAQNGVTDFNLTLPATQDYIIQVVPQGGNVVDYEVTVKIQ